MPQIGAIQSELRSAGVDGWLFCDFHHRDPIAARVLALDNGMGTRRWYYLIPSRGEPRKLVHRIEAEALDSLPGRKLTYASLAELQRGLRHLIGSCRKVAMQYSPRNAIPYVSLVDAGTVELVRAQGCRVVSSADLVQKFDACWSREQLAWHAEAGRVIDQVTQEAFGQASVRARKKKPLSEYDLQQWIVDRLGSQGVTSDEPPIVAVGRHTGNPHYEPKAKGSARVREGELLLLDIWGKLDRPHSVYYDITWMGYLGSRVPERYARIFAVVREARDRAVTFVQKSLAAGRGVRGWQVDRIAREAIRKAGYARYFVHRTGHNIGEEVHGNGANLDGWETHDVRRILPQTCFSVEPGIYLPEFGVRSEVDVYVDQNGARTTGAVQEAILPLLA